MTSAKPHWDPIHSFAENVLVEGDRVESRYGLCIESLGGRLDVPSGILVAREGINLSLGWMEFLQLVAGVYDLDALKAVAPKADHSLFTYAMAYGPRIYYKAPAIIEALQDNPNTRQAVLFVAKPDDGPTSNLPCTLTIQFVIRHRKIHAIVSMRSWDLCRGLPYDLMMFSGLLEIIGRCLDIPAGRVIVQAGSVHVYTGWANRLPFSSQHRWAFKDEVPREWNEARRWAAKNISLLPTWGIPQGIEYVLVGD